MRTLLLAALACLGFSGCAASWAQAPEVTIGSGTLRGLHPEALPRGGAFLGIPFAAQPVGNLRWRAPELPPRWPGVRDAQQYGPACPQFPSPWLPEMLGIRSMPTNEACLYLNVWTPDLRQGANLPVFVWVHGGGNVEGSGEWPPLGVTLAQKGIVVVSLNYRLGVFGFLAGTALDAESAHHVSGNYGHLDQLAALEWVRRNIRQFGGNPGRVTIGGQSSGALDVCNLMASPLARGLFEGAVLQSGVCVDSVYPTLQEVSTGVEQLAKDFGIAAGAEALSRLRALPTDRVMQAAAADANLDLEPDIDGWVLPQQAAETFAHGRQLAVPVLEGSNEDEVSIFASSLVVGRSWRPATVAQYRDWLRNRFHSLADQVFAEYPARSDGDARRAFETMDTDFDFGFGAWLLAHDTARIGRKAFLYHFTYVGPGEFAALGAFHAEESMFLSRRYWTTWTARPADQPLSRIIIGYWVQFVKTGNPNGADLPAWPTYSPQDRVCQRLGRRIGPEPVPRLKNFPVFQQYLTSRLEQQTAH